MRPRRRVQSSLPAPDMRLPTRSLESIAETRGKDGHSYEHGDEPKPFVSFGWMRSWSVSVQGQRMFLDFAHGEKVIRRGEIELHPSRL